PCDLRQRMPLAAAVPGYVERAARLPDDPEATDLGAARRGGAGNPTRIAIETDASRSAVRLERRERDALRPSIDSLRLVAGAGRAHADRPRCGDVRVDEVRSEAGLPASRTASLEGKRAPPCRSPFPGFGRCRRQRLAVFQQRVVAVMERVHRDDRAPLEPHDAPRLAAVGSDRNRALEAAVPSPVRAAFPAGAEEAVLPV